MRASYNLRQEERCIVLDAQTFDGIVAVRQPDALGALEDAKVDAPTAAGAAFNLHMRKIGTQTVDQRIGPARLRSIGHGQHAVVVPLDIVNRVIPQDRCHTLVDEIPHFGQRHVDGFLLASQCLVFRSQRPMRIGAV